MSDIAIRVENLSKRYRIGKQQARYNTLRDSLSEMALSPIRRVRGLFSGNGASAADLEETIWALKDVSFEVKKGEVVGIIGRNGAGKSTLLKVLSRITEPTEGTVDLYGRVGSLLEVGTGFHPELTGRENIYLNGAILGMKKAEIERKFDEIVDFSGVEKFIDTPVKHYSSGMYVRLAFAVAAHLEPEILLVDEVLAVGDAAFQKKCLGKMGQVAEEGRTVLFVSHNMGAITNLTNRCFLLNEGSFHADGYSERVVKQYLSSFEDKISKCNSVDLATAKRGIGDRKKGEFVCVELLDTITKKGKTEVFENEPFIIKVSIEIKKEAENIQIGCGIGTVDMTGQLFTVPSQVYVGELKKGLYSASIAISPNYLRSGSYFIALKLFINGRRQDSVPRAMLLQIKPFVSNDDEGGYFQKWVSGLLRIDYKWEDLVNIEDNANIMRRSILQNEIT